MYSDFRTIKISSLRMKLKFDSVNFSLRHMLENYGYITITIIP